MLEKEQITPEMHGLIRIPQVEYFVNADIGKRMGAAEKDGKLYREKPFVMGFTEEELENYGFGVGSNTDSCENIYEKTDSDQEKEEQKKVRHEEDLTLIQGIIDVFWIEKDGIVLLDYKTDRVQQAKELIDRYATQLKLYADALERVFAARKLKVKEILIYSFSLEQLITL